MPGFFLSSKYMVKPITMSHIRIELPLREKKENNMLKISLWGKRFFKNKVIDPSSRNKLSILNIIQENPVQPLEFLLWFQRFDRVHV